MKKIYKYELKLAERQVVDMPNGADILTIQVQDGKIAMWALVDTQQPTQEREFFLYGTGNPITKPDWISHHDYIASVQMRGGLFVWHLFGGLPVGAPAPEERAGIDHEG